jgi:hypothetical protein
VDWKADDDSADLDEDNVFDCESSPAPNQSPPIGNFAYFVEKCIATGWTYNRGTQYDWLRFLWDCNTDALHGGHSVPSIFQILDDADPDSWNANGNLNADSDNPYERLKDASGEGCFGCDFLSLASNHGVNW